ncbi:ParB/RepB/Spo0J family partition protein [Saccharothrix violaceirubra]|uniref:ParB family chromosome partitioning protein n=1 Tax=Saccharothrix violaceirubra TaxID=413306 RepID=A0A7W7T048_9PSEU|nr:hypothetical protein [Saccharothrix violaceirubra]MBB4963552.1 ParB family chromosome partitioning protein [Saccharothrix violaceirubra]
MSGWENARFELVDPRVLLVDRNSRTVTDVERERPELCASIRRHGVVVPVIANPTGEGLRVRDGHSRTIVSRSVVERFPVIPVIVTEAADTEEWHWLRDQWIANEVRAGYGTGDRMRIFEELTLFGLGPDEVAAELGTDVEVVHAGLRARRSEAVVAAVERHPEMTLDQAAGLASFEDDEEVYRHLTEVLDRDPDTFDYALAEQREESRLRREAAELRERLAREGIAVVEEIVSGTLPLTRLRDQGRTVAPEDHLSCPGHAALVTSDDGDGVVRATWLCRDWAGHGHTDSWQATSEPHRPWDAERKAERAQVVRSNQAWRAAETVRRTKLRELLARSTPPRGALRFVVESLLAGDDELLRAARDRHALACRLPGLREPGAGRTHPLTSKLRGQDRLTTVLLAIVLAAYEQSTGPQTWRTPTPGQKRYFAALTKWGLARHWVEKLVTDIPEAA